MKSAREQANKSERRRVCGLRVAYANWETHVTSPRGLQKLGWLAMGKF